MHCKSHSQAGRQRLISHLSPTLTAWNYRFVNKKHKTCTTLQKAQITKLRQKKIRSPQKFINPRKKLKSYTKAMAAMIKSLQPPAQKFRSIPLATVEVSIHGKIAVNAKMAQEVVHDIVNIQTKGLMLRFPVWA